MRERINREMRVYGILTVLPGREETMVLCLGACNVSVSP